MFSFNPLILRRRLLSFAWCNVFLLTACGVMIVSLHNVALADTSQFNFTGTVSSVGCTVDSSSSLSVPMGDWLSTEFTGSGSATSSQPVNVPLTCDAGVKVMGTVIADADPAQPGTMKLTSSGSGSSAGGVGIQLLDKVNAPIVLNQQFLIDTTQDSGQYVITWHARYIQTGSGRVIAGPANSTAMLTLSYN